MTTSTPLQTRFPGILSLTLSRLGSCRAVCAGVVGPEPTRLVGLMYVGLPITRNPLQGGSTGVCEEYAGVTCMGKRLYQVCCSKSQGSSWGAVTRPVEIALHVLGGDVPP